MSWMKESRERNRSSVGKQRQQQRQSRDQYTLWELSPSTVYPTIPPHHSHLSVLNELSSSLISVVYPSRLCCPTILFTFLSLSHYFLVWQDVFALQSRSGLCPAIWPILGTTVGKVTVENYNTCLKTTYHSYTHTPVYTPTHTLIRQLHTPWK